MRRIAGVMVGLVLVAWCLLLLAWAVLHWGILPHVNEWRPRIEARATQALGVPVRLGRIELLSNGWMPQLQLHDVVLSDRDGRPALRLPRVSATVSARSVLALSLRFEQLLIDGADLEVRRDAQGRWFVAGLQMQSAAGEGGDAVADWFFEQHEFVIRRGRLRWVDEQRQAPPLALHDVDVVVRNGLKRHALRIDATPPPEWGERFSLRGQFRQPLLARSGNWRRWSGTVYADLPRADVLQLKRHLSLPFELNAGEGALRVWMDWREGRPAAATVDMALNAVQLRLHKRLAPLELALLQGRLQAERDDQGVQLSAQALRFVTGEGERWLPSQWSVRWQQRQDVDNAPVTGGQFQADRLDLGVVASIAERLPLGDAVRRLLAQTAPEGQVQALQGRWTGAPDAPQRYEVKARLSGLSIAPGPVPAAPQVGRPGWRNAEVELSASERGGEARLAVHQGALAFPGVFDEPEIPMDRLEAQLAWRIDRRGDGGLPAVEVAVSHASFANADAAGELQARWRTGPGEGHGASRRYPGQIELSGRLSRGEATRVARYLPLGIALSARQYVARSVQAGRVEAASFRVRGDLWNFPFAQTRDGEFQIAGRVSGVRFAYVPSTSEQPSRWPAFDDVAGELVFDRGGMQIRQARAAVLGYELSRVHGRIADLGHDPVLQIEGQGRGPLAEALRFVQTSPLNDWLGQGLSTAQAQGASELRLALSLPLDRMDASTVKGRLTLLGNELRLRPDVPLLSQARGRVDFTQAGFALHGVSARALGGELQLDGGTQADGSLRLVAQGTLSAEGLRRAHELPALARLAQPLSGQAPYRLQLGVHQGRTELAFSSPLTGLALDLPAPFGKAADTASPLRVAVQAQPDGPGGAPRDLVRLDWGPLLQAQFHRDLSRPVPQVLRSAIAVQEPLPPAQHGGVAQLQLAQLDLDAWRRLTARVMPAAGAGATAHGATAGEDGSAAYLPRQLNVRARELLLAGRRLTQLQATVQRMPGDSGWRAQLAAEQLAGEVEVRHGAGGDPGRVQARLGRLHLPQAEAKGVERLLDEAPAQVPALDIVVDDFQLGAKRLGRLQVQAHNRPDTRDWRLSRLQLHMPEATIQATGQWSAPQPLQPRRRMTLGFEMDVADGGALLQRLGTPDAIKGAKGQVRGEVSWLGSPFALDYPSLDGEVHVALDQGQFLKAGAGAGRLLGVLSLQSLPRRLLLDFRDVFQQGFAFDQLGGDLQIRQGVASTQNLRMRGVQAEVVMAGQADLERETHNLRVVVVPEVNAAAASLAYATINPAIGLGTFVAQLFLRKPLMQAGTREFHVSGPWDDPKVERVERKFSDPLPEPPAPAAPDQLKEP